MSTSSHSKNPNNKAMTAGRLWLWTPHDRRLEGSSGKERKNYIGRSHWPWSSWRGRTSDTEWGWKNILGVHKIQWDIFCYSVALLFLYNVQILQLWPVTGTVTLQDKGLACHIRGHSWEGGESTVGSTGGNSQVTAMALGSVAMADVTLCSTQLPLISFPRNSDLPIPWKTCTWMK